MQTLSLLFALSAVAAYSPSWSRISSSRVARNSQIEMRKKSITDLTDADLRGKTVWVRSDLNVPLKMDTDEDGEAWRHYNAQQQLITDDTRLRASMPTIQYLSERGAKVLVASHLGRPQQFEKSVKSDDDEVGTFVHGDLFLLSLYPIAQWMEKAQNQTNAEKGTDTVVSFCHSTVTGDVKGYLNIMRDGDILVMENTRFYADEEMNHPYLSERFVKASDADFYVNDAFGTAHRAHCSTVGITDFIKGPKVAGLLMEKELTYLQETIANPPRPFAAIVGGSKVSTKIGVIESLLDKVDKLVIGGGMVFTFLKARGLEVGSSLVEEDQLELATKLEKIAAEKGVDLILPSDIVVADKFDADAATQIVSADAIPEGWMGLDNGPAATSEIQSKLSDCKTVIWNGPMGVFEMEAFAKGTFSLCDTLADLTSKGCITIIGGGDSVAAVEKAGIADKMSHISTGGGATLELLEGKELPGVAALDDA